MLGLRISGISRAGVAGSFIFSTSATIEGTERYLNVHPVLSCWHTAGCANYQTHLNFRVIVPLHSLTHPQADKVNFEVCVQTHDNPKGTNAKEKFPNLKMPLGKIRLQQR
jgi:tyrosinase